MQVLTLLYLLLVLQFLNVSGERRYSVFSEQQCFSSPPSCLTLSQFAHQYSANYTEQNTTVHIYAGNHTLDTGLSITNAAKFSMLATSDIDTYIECTHSANLYFENIDHLYIKGLKFIGCGGNQLRFVYQATIQHSMFFESRSNESSLIVYETTANITDTIFMLNTARHNLYLIYPGYCQKIINSGVGGAMTLTHSTVALNNCRFEDNKANIGGAIYSNSRSNITITNSNFTSNHAIDCYPMSLCHGGAMYVIESSQVSVYNSTFRNNTSNGRGGLGTLDHATLIVSNSVSDNNMAVGDGGTVAAFNGSTIIFKATTFRNSISYEYGGVVTLFESSISIYNCNFSNNTANYGGVVNLDESSISIYNCNFSNNTANHGGIIKTTKSIVTVQDSIFVKNTASVDGGVLHATLLCYINVINSFLINNTANHNGVVYVSCSSVTLIRGCFFTSNRANNWGGAVFGEYNCTIIIVNSSFAQCAAHSHGGGIFGQNSCSISIQNSSLTNNVAKFGGAFYVWIRTTITIQKSVFNGNSANIDGSVLFSSTTSEVTIHNCSFLNNSAVNDGILHVSYNTTIMIRSSTFSDNKVTNNGGVAYLYYGCNITIHNCTFTNNVAHNNGGAIYGRENINIGIKNCTFRNCSSAYAGGSVYAQLNSHINIGTSTLDTNTADMGGALSVYTTSSAYIKDSNFVKNRGNIRGGAMDVFKRSFLQVQNCSFTYNMAIDGGVIAVIQNSNLTVNNSSFCHNKADNGAIMRAIQALHVVFNGSTFQHNTANYGGVLNAKYSKIIVEQSSFEQNIVRYSGGVMYIANNSDINVTVNTFSNNTSENDGGVISLVSSSTTNITSCNFTKNKAQHNGGVISIQESSANIQNSMFNLSSVRSSGGVIYSSNSSIEVFISSFVDNSERDRQEVADTHLCNSRGQQLCNSFSTDCTTNSGGVLYLEKNSTCTIVKSIFTRNRVESCGGAISVTESSNVTIVDSTFNQNMAKFGAAMAAYQASFIFINRFNFNQTNIHHSRDTIATHICNNIAKLGGGFYLSGSNLYIKTITNVSQNQANSSGGGIYAIDSTIVIGNTIHFSRNQAKTGGGVSLANSKVNDTIDGGVVFNANFVSNRADFGGALFIYDEIESNVCFNDNYTALYSSKRGCFFENVTKGLMINFIDNYANTSGHDLYGGLLDRCTVASFTNISKLEQSGVNYFKEISNIKDFETISSYPSRVCLCKNNQPDCSQQNHSIEVKKGKKFIVSIAATNQMDRLTMATIHSKFKHANLSENQTIRTIGSRCSDLDFEVFFPQDGKEYYELDIYMNGPCNNMPISGLKVNVHVQECSCPPGFMPTAECECDCDKQLSTYTEKCNITIKSIMRKGKYWIAYIEDNDNDSSYHYLIKPYCPLNYCQPPTKSVYVNLRNGSDAQCANNRGGILCGSCLPHFSLSLSSSKCIKCPKHWYGQLIGIVIAAFFAGIILVVLLLVLNLTVAIGTLNSIIFYANIIHANKNLYFTESHLTFVPVFISWLNMDIGFDTCFYEGMDNYGKTWLQLLFPAYIFCLVIAVILFSSLSFKFSKVIAKRNPVATLATLILLSYTNFLETIITSLSFATLEYPNGTTVIAWRPDAKVKYGKGKHIPLIILAFCILIIGLLYTILIFSWQWLLRFSKTKVLKWTRNQKIHAFIETYHIPYNAKHRYWTGLLLLVRVIVYLISAFSASINPRITLLSTLIIVCCLLLYKNVLEVRPYRQWILNALESLTFFNIAIFSALTWYTFDEPSNSDTSKTILQTVASYISVGIVLLQFVLAVIYHIYRYGSATVYSIGQSTSLSKRLNRNQSYDSNVDHSTSEDVDFYRLFDLSDSQKECASYSPPPKSQRQKPTSTSISLSECEEM